MSLTILIENPSEMNRLFSENDIDYDNFIWLMESLVNEDILITNDNYFCPSCSSFIENVDPFQPKLFCESCEWEGSYNELIKHKIYSMNSDNRVIINDFSFDEQGIIRIIGNDIKVELPKFKISKIEEFDVSEIEEEYTKGELKEMSEELLSVKEDDENRTNENEDLTGMFCTIFNQERLAHGSEEIADLLPAVKYDENDVLCAFVIKSNRDRSSSTTFRDKIIS